MFCKSRGRFLAVIIALAAGGLHPSTLRAADAPGPVEALKIAVDAYIYGYPLVTFDMARAQQTNVATPDAEHAPVNQMILMRSYPAVDNHCCAAPNADTLYTEAWLDLSKEPQILVIPEMGDRYYILPFIDGWSEVFAVSSHPLNGGAAQTYAVTGPGWNGPLPEGVTELKSPTDMVWMLGRIYSDGTAADYDAVHALQDRIELFPLSAWGKDWTPPDGVVDPSVDMETSVRSQVNALDAEAYFNRLARLMATNRPTAADAPMAAEMARIGLVPGKDFDLASLDFLDREIFRAVPKLALLEMGVHLKRQPAENGWLFFTKGVGAWGADYLTRGMGNLLGPGWNRPEDAVYPLSQKDADGGKYDGEKHDYVVRFEKGQLPPADGFWSLSMYDSDLFFVPNTINRYELSQRNAFVTGPDGSVELYLQSESPGKDKEANWLPAPKDTFMLVLRLYDPSKSAPSLLDGSWTPPAVTVAK